MLPIPFHFFELADAAAPFAPPEFSGPVRIVGYGVAGFLAAGILVLTFLEKWKSFMNPRPAATVAFQAQPSGDQKAAEPVHPVIDIKGLVAISDFTEHKEATERRARGLEEQISSLRHEWREKIQPILTRIEDRDEAAKEWRDEIGDRVHETGKELAAAQADLKNVVRSQDNINNKLDRLIERHIAPLASTRST